MYPLPPAPEHDARELTTRGMADQGVLAQTPTTATPAARSLWSRAHAWVAENTFDSLWGPETLRRPLAGYAMAVALELAAALLTIGLVLVSPTFSFFGMLNILVVVIVALSWGAAPGLVATLSSAVALETIVLPAVAHSETHMSDIVEIAVCLVVGACISVFASSAEQARRRAVTEHADAQARELALSEMNARTDEFLSIASHELRSPLTSLKMALQMGERRLERLANQKMPSDELARELGVVQRLLATARQQVDRQDQLVGDLLDVSRIRANRLEYRIAACDLASIVYNAVEEQRLSWPERAIMLDAPEAPAPVEADAQRIGQVVTNYLTNALKYSAKDAPVEVSLRIADGQARVAVRDSGPGLTAEQQRHIWDRFHRVPGITQQSGSGAGLGLGLHISRTIVAHHGGDVGIESMPKQGSTFWFTLPLAHAPDHAPDLVSEAR
ncbi:MAG TPA: HAMP domain-containing sensor histidine kinase [Ktedonobacterales bacterium]